MSANVIKAIDKRHAFYCPGCQRAHYLDGWQFNDDFVKPTFTPSVLVYANAGHFPHPQPRCHSYITDGRIQFLTDSTHELSGQMVDLLPFPEGWFM